MSSEAVRRVGRATVSVVITTIGRPELHRAVRSALGQTRLPDEIVVVYDSHVEPPSVDVSSDGVDLRIVRSEGRGGNAARNTGARLANGDYVAYIDDDDYWFADKLEQQLQVAEANTGPQIVCCQAFDEYRAKAIPQRVYRDGPPADYLFCRPLHHPMFDAQIQTSGLLITRTLLLEHPLDEKLFFHQDWDWLIKVSAQPEFKLTMVPRVLYYFTSSAQLKVSRHARLRLEQEWALANLPPQSHALFGYFWTVSVTRAIESGDYRFALGGALRSFKYGRAHLGSLFSGLVYAIGIMLRRKVRRVELFQQPPRLRDRSGGP